MKDRRVQYSEFAFQGPGWFVEMRRLRTRSIWEGPFATEAEANKVREALDYVDKELFG